LIRSRNTIKKQHIFVLKKSYFLFLSPYFSVKDKQQQEQQTTLLFYLSNLEESSS